MSYTPDIAIIIAIFGGILLIIGVIIISTGEGEEGKGSWRNAYYYHGDR
jgi:hypothetical protein